MGFAYDVCFFGKSMMPNKLKKAQIETTSPHHVVFHKRGATDETTNELRFIMTCMMATSYGVWIWSLGILHIFSNCSGVC